MLRSAGHFLGNTLSSIHFCPKLKKSSTLEFVCHSQNPGWSFALWGVGKGSALPLWKLSLKCNARKPCDSWIISQSLLILELAWSQFLPNSSSYLVSSDSCEHRFFWVILSAMLWSQMCSFLSAVCAESPWWVMKKTLDKLKSQQLCFPGLKEEHLNSDTFHLEDQKQGQESEDHLKLSSKRRI